MKVSVLCPCGVNTPILRGGAFGKIDEKIALDEHQEMQDRMTISAETLAIKALKGIEKNKAIIVVPGAWKILWWI